MSDATDQFLGEIRIFGCNFAPTGWAPCNGQLVPISQNTALFALLGTVYGGDGKSTFALPNLQEQVPVHSGYSTGNGLTGRSPGEQGGSQTVTLLQSEIPAHTHGIRAADEPGDLSTPDPARVLARPGGGSAYAPSGALTTMDERALVPAGGSLPHNNLQPTLVVNFCIALQGIFPQRP